MNRIETPFLIERRKKQKNIIEPLKKIEQTSIEPMALYQRLDSRIVLQHLKTYEELESTKPEEFDNIKRTLIDRLLDKPGEIDPHEIVGFLFLASRQRFENVDLQIEQKSIESVCEMLIGNNLHLDKGDGKTSTAIPIYATFRSLLNRVKDEPAVIISASDEAKVEELQKELRNFKNQFTRLLKPETGNRQTKEIEEIKTKLIDSQIPDFDSESMLSKRPNDVIRFAEVNEIKMLLLTHHQLTFDLEKDEKRWGKYPPMVIDEIQYLDKLPSHVSLTVGKENNRKIIEENIDEYFFARLVSDLFGKEDSVRQYFTFGNKLPELNEEATLLLKDVVKKLDKYFSQKDGSFDQLLENVANETGVDKNKISYNLRKFWKKLTSRNYKMMLPALKEKDYENDRQQFLFSKATEFASVSVSLREGVEKSGDNTVRDVYRGIKMTNQKFDEKNEFWLGVFKKKFIVPRDELVANYFHLPAWLNLVLGGRAIGLSGSLFGQTIDGKIKKTPLAGMLSEFTEGEVINLSQEKPPLPIPYLSIAENSNFMINEVIKKSSEIKDQKKPHLIVCWDELTAKDLLKKMKEKKLNINIVNEDSSPSDLEDIFRNLADGKLDAVISSGQGSFGQNIKDFKGNFPELQVSVINPMTEFQVTQAFSRNRRKEKTIHDFSIFFNMGELSMLSSFLSKKDQDHLNKLLTERKEIQGKYKEMPELSGLVTYVRGIDDEIKRLTFKAMSSFESKDAVNYLEQAQQEVIFFKEIVPKIKEGKEIAYRQYLESDDTLVNRIRDLIKGTIPLANEEFVTAISDSVKEGLINNITNVESSVYQDYELDLYKFKMNPDNNGLQKDWVRLFGKNYWENKLKDSPSKWSKDLADPTFIESRVDPYLQVRMDYYRQVMELITDYIRKESPKNIFVDEIMKRIIGFAEIDLPFYPYDTEGRQMLSPDGAISLPWGQKLKNIITLGQAFITPPLLFPQEKMNNNIRFHPIPKNIEELMLGRINKLNNIKYEEKTEKKSADILNINIPPNSTDTTAIIFQLKTKLGVV